MKSYIILLITSGLLFSCCGDKPSDESKTLSQTPVESYSEDDFAGPPFSDTCLCDFDEFGDYKISLDNYNIYKRGKGWNPNYYSCSKIGINNLF